MSLNESIVEDAALEWFGELGYAVGHGPHLAPGEPAAEREPEREPERSGDSRRHSFGEVVLVGRLREAIRRLNPAIPGEARAAIKRILKARFGRRTRP
jgi:type I restriction enzyme R subunit